MKINVHIDDSYTETEITIHSGKMSDELEKAVALLRVLDYRLTGSKTIRRTFWKPPRSCISIQRINEPFYTPKRTSMKRPCGCTNWNSGFQRGTFSAPENPASSTSTE